MCEKHLHCCACSSVAVSLLCTLHSDAHRIQRAKYRRIENLACQGVGREKRGSARLRSPASAAQAPYYAEAGFDLVSLDRSLVGPVGFEPTTKGL